MIARTAQPTRLAGCLLLLLLAGLPACAAADDDSGAGSAPAEAPRTVTRDEVIAALPTLDQVPRAAEELLRCPGPKDCQDDRAGVALALEPSIDEAEAKRRFGDVPAPPENAALYASAEEDAAAAERRLATARAREEAFDGRFSTRGTKTDDGFTFGHRGTGTLADVTIEGWTGYLGKREQVLTDPDGGVETAPMDVATIHVARGNVTIEVFFHLFDDDRPLQDSEVLARRLVADYIERLG